VLTIIFRIRGSSVSIETRLRTG